jgi:hypothetical protein
MLQSIPVSVVGRSLLSISRPLLSSMVPARLLKLGAGAGARASRLAVRGGAALAGNGVLRSIGGLGSVEGPFLATAMLAVLLQLAEQKKGLHNRSVHGEDVPQVKFAKPLSGAAAREVTDDRDLREFRARYIAVHLLCSFADLLQGAYVFRLYESKGLPMEIITRLLMSSIVSAMVCGTWTGTAVDRFGRRAGCLAFCVLHIVQCLCLFSESFNILLLGRLLSGAASTLLGTSFETWLIAEHHGRCYPPQVLEDTFAQFVKLTGGAAVVAGLFAGALVDGPLGLGLVAPFTVSAAIGVAAAVLLLLLWGENYGSPAPSESLRSLGWWRKGALGGFSTLSKVSREGRAVGIFQALFEGALLSFIVLWSPILDTTNPAGFAPLNLGLAFAAFMIAIHAGSSICQLLIRSLEREGGEGGAERVLVGVGAVSSICYLGAALKPGTTGMMFFFLALEVCAGAYYTASAVLRSRHIQDNVRGAVTNIFRVGLNGVAAGLLLGPMGSSWGMELKQTVVLSSCAFLCSLSAAVAATQFPKRPQKGEGG